MEPVGLLMPPFLVLYKRVICIDGLVSLKGCCY